MNLQETVLMQLRDLILRGTFEPGQRLAEQQLAERLGASRTPVRSALVTVRKWATPVRCWRGSPAARRETSPSSVAIAAASSPGESTRRDGATSSTWATRVRASASLPSRSRTDRTAAEVSITRWGRRRHG